MKSDAEIKKIADEVEAAMETVQVLNKSKKKIHCSEKWNKRKGRKSKKTLLNSIAYNAKNFDHKTKSCPNCKALLNIHHKNCLLCQQPLPVPRAYCDWKITLDIEREEGRMDSSPIQIAIAVNEPARKVCAVKTGI